MWQDLFTEGQSQGIKDLFERGINEALCVDNLFLNEICVFHVMDSGARYSS